MKVKRIVVGDLQANCYILIFDNNAILIDPGDEPSKIENELKNLNLIGILVTHHHFDHIGALSYFEDKYNLKHNTKILGINYEVIETPGHSLDLKTFYFPEEEIMFTGDFIFKNTIGRMDLPGGSVEMMQKSLEKISKYPDDIIIYPGHYDKTTLGEEKKYFSYYI